ncbi:MAG TPA: TolC family protein [Puia sp.]|nr:TolC family protein [Puia sp.]
MKGFRILILIIFSSLNLTGYAQDSVMHTLTLQQCVDIAIQNNLQVRQSELQMESNGVQFKQAKDNLLPQINGTLNQGQNFGRSINNFNNGYVNQQYGSGSYGLNASLTLFNGLSLLQGIKQNALSYDASKMDLQQQKDNITLSVILAYLQVLSSQDQLVIAKQQTEVDAKQVERLEILNKQGAIAPSTLYDLKGQYASDQVNEVNMVNALETAKVNLFGYLNIPYQKDAGYEMVMLDANTLQYGNSSDSIYQTALQTVPTIRAVDLRVKSFEHAVAAARGKYYPTLSLYGSLNSNYSSIATNNIPGTDYPIITSDYIIDNTNTKYYVNTTGLQTQKISFGDQFKNNRFQQVGLQLNIPILNYLSVRNNVKQAKINLDNAKVIASSSRNQLQQLVEQAWQNMNAAYGQYKGYLDQVKAYGESFRTAEIRFNNGVITSVDYVIAKNNYDRANTNLTAARYNYIFRTKILDYYQGRLSIK